MRVFAVAVAIGCASVAYAAPKPKPKPVPVVKKPPDPPPSPEKVRADALFQDGRRYLASKEFALACTAFEQSQLADPGIGTQLNIALCYEEWGHIAASYRAYLEALRLAKEGKDDRQNGAQMKVDQLASMVPHLQVEIPAELQHRMLADRVVRGEEGSEFQARHGGVSPDRIVLVCHILDGSGQTTGRA